jgi:hypothetical protein
MTDGSDTVSAISGECEVTKVIHVFVCIGKLFVYSSCASCCCLSLSKMFVFYDCAVCSCFLWLLCLFCSIPFPSSELCERKELLASFALSFNDKEKNHSTGPVEGKNAKQPIKSGRLPSYRDTLVCCFDCITVKMQTGSKMHKKRTSGESKLLNAETGTMCQPKCCRTVRNYRSMGGNPFPPFYQMVP